MTTYHGATVVLRLSRLAAEGKISREYLGDLDGSGEDQDFYTANYPITTAAGVTTDDETEVDVFMRSGDDFIELDDDGSDFTIDGSEGLVTVKAAVNQPGNAGRNISVSYYTDGIVSRGQGASVEFSRDVQEVHELGSAAPQELVAGHYTVSGTIEALYVSRDLMGKVLGETDLYKQLSSFSFYIYPNGNTAGQPYIKVTNATFEGGTIKATLKGLVAVNVKYKGTAASIGTV